MKIQPSLERVKVSGVPVFEMEAASSSSETRLFCFFSPEKRTFASVTRANPQINSDNKIEAIGVIFIISIGVLIMLRWWQLVEAFLEVTDNPENFIEGRHF